MLNCKDYFVSRERSRILEEEVITVPWRKQYGTAWQPLPYPPIDVCSLPFTVKIYNDTVKVPTVYESSLIRDEIITQAGRDFLKVDPHSSIYCFKNVFHQRSSRGMNSVPILQDWHYTIGYSSRKARMCQRWAPSNAIGIDHAGAEKYYRPLAEWLRHNPATIHHDVTSRDIARAYNSLLPTLASELDIVSVPNFLLELRDLKRLGDLFSTKYRDIGQAGGDKFLGINFGVLPLVSDIKKMLSMTQSITDYITQWNELANKQAVTTFKSTIFNFGGTESISIDNFLTGYLNDRATIIVETTNIAKLHLYVIPKPLPYNVTVAKAKLKLYGFDNPAYVVWEAIPFSFVVDWFTNIGDLFEDGAIDTLLLYDIVDAGYSYKVGMNAQCTLSCERTPPGGQSADGNYPVEPPPTWEENSTYTRVRLDLKSLERLTLSQRGWQFETSMLSPHQAALGAALKAK